MKLTKSAMFYATFLTFLTLGATVPSSNAEASSVGYECNMDSERLKEISTVAGFKAYLESIDIPYQKYISKAGATLTVNKTYAADRCLIVYGTPSSVKTEGRKKQEQGENGEHKFLGYDQNGNLFANPEYPDYKGGVDYVKKRPFYYQPWANTELNNYIKTDPNKPYTVNPNTSSSPQPTYKDPSLGRVRTKAEELDRAIDRMYIAYCTGSCSLGRRGNFTQTNTALNLKLVGSNLVKYASVNNYPNAYVAGTFELYYKSTLTGKTWFSTFYLPPYKQVLNENRDLTATITSAPSSVIENQNYTVKYQVCNKGEVIVKKPIIHYGEGSATKSLTLNTTLKPGACYTGSLSNTASSVTANTNKNYVVIVNKAASNPAKENNTSNNTASKSVTIQDNFINGSVSIVSHSPTNPQSNQQMSVSIKVCNESATAVDNIVVKYGFKGNATDSKTISRLAAGTCTTFSASHKAPIIESFSGAANYEATLATFNGDSDSSDNKATKSVTIKNPDAMIEAVSSTNSSTTVSGISDIKIKITNNMLSKISNTCGNSSATLPCVTTGTGRPGKMRINVYDTKFTEDTSDDKLIYAHQFASTFSLAAGESTVVTISKDILLKHVEENYKSKYQLVQFKVNAEIPHFQGEVDFEGNDSYTNNRNESFIVYYPERPNIAATKCNVVQHSYIAYFNTDGVNPIKICMGHFPTYPSTTVESGMQAYHFVLYRFFPTPFPKYTVTTPEKDITNPNHFSQLFELPSTEKSDQLGDSESMFIPNTIVNGYYQERGRYMPTGGTFNFKVYKKSNNAEQETVALGSVSYTIPQTCYNTEALDIRHLYGCDEILFFLPNYNSSNKQHQKPDDYSKEDIVYPIENTKIPYLNPGKYTFEFNATEQFKYYYQKNKSTTGYDWSQPKFE